jgi:hypothetical protein
MKTKRDYQRLYLRAPYNEPVLYVDGDFVFKARSLNISEGGLLLDQVPHFPESNDDVPLMISLRQMPLFKNFTLDRLKLYSPEMTENIVVRLKSSMVRKFGIESKAEQAFTSRVGLRFTDVPHQAEMAIKEYVKVFSSNLIYLQVLIDSLNTDEQNIEKARLLASILGYDRDQKISILFKKVQHDYQSLQWL